MKILISLLMILVILLLNGCTNLQTAQLKSQEPIKQENSEEDEQIEDKVQYEDQDQFDESEQIEDSGLYKTLLSPDNELSIVRTPSAADFSLYYPDKLTELPSYNSESNEIWQVDLRSRDLTELDLKTKSQDLLYASFDSKTKWPDNLPNDFDPQLIMELGKNPGLGVRELHKKGITGKGIGIAIIDQGLLVDHIEYKDQLKLYEEIHCVDNNATMHGPAVASIAVGKTVGVAPEANLYYIAETHGVFKEEGFEWDLTWIAKSIDRIVEINKLLTEEEKIRVISISLGINKDMNGYEKVLKSIEEARQEGIYTVYVSSNPFMGLGRYPLKDPEINTSYSMGVFWEKYEYKNDMLLVPMDSRCTASPTGPEDYVFYREGGMSWAVPYIAGLYALAYQVNSNITPEIFWSEAFNTSDTISINENQEFGKIVNPIKLMERIEKMNGKKQ